MKDFFGLPVDSMSNAHIRLEYLTSVGPRIVRLFLGNSEENIFAETPDISWKTPYGDFFLRGGHRLWTAPETPNLTTAPDNVPILVEKDSSSIVLIESSNPYSGLSKSIKIRLDPEAPRVHLEHKIQNNSSETVELSPWAISVLNLGGMAILPFSSPTSDPEIRTPDRNLVFWPYTQVDDPRLMVKADYLFVSGSSRENEFKVGYRNTAGWIGYAKDNTLFCKHFNPQSNSKLPDWDCNVEVFVNNRFIELETLGPLIDLEPGEAATHLETWELFLLTSHPKTKTELISIVNQHLL